MKKKKTRNRQIQNSASLLQIFTVLTVECVYAAWTHKFVPEGFKIWTVFPQSLGSDKEKLQKKQSLSPTQHWLRYQEQIIFASRLCQL